MQKLLIAFVMFFVFFTNAPVSEEADRFAGIEQKHGSLIKRVKKAAGDRFQEESDKFKVPTVDQQKAWTEVIKRILNNEANKANSIIKKQLIPYKMIRFTDDSTKREYLLLEEYPVNYGWGIYVFDPGSRNHLVIEVPHPIYDANTDLEGIEAFLETGAKAFLLAGAHRRTSPRLSPCTQATSRSRYMESDVAHATQTMFHSTHEVLHDQYPDTVAVQLHGMRNRDTCPNVFLSTGTKDVTTNSKKLLNCLVRRNVESGIFDGKTHTCILVARTNAQGRYSNGKKDEACNEYAEASPEPGHFIHVEQEPEIRKNRKSWRPVIEALKCAFPNPKEEREKNQGVMSTEVAMRPGDASR